MTTRRQMLALTATAVVGSTFSVSAQGDEAVPGSSKITQIRNATLQIVYGGVRFLVDPMLRHGVLPLAIAMGVDPVLAGTAVFSGAALGSTTCLYGDGIILASKSVGVRPLTLMTSILPYAGAAAVLSFIAYLIAGFVMI